MPTPVPFVEATWMQTFGRFLSRHGFGTVVAIYLIYNMVVNTNTKADALALQLKDLNGQLLHASQAISLHADESKSAAMESLRVQRAICVILAQTPAEKRDCVQ